MGYALLTSEFDAICVSYNSVKVFIDFVVLITKH